MVKSENKGQEVMVWKFSNIRKAASECELKDIRILWGNCVIQNEKRKLV